MTAWNYKAKIDGAEHVFCGKISTCFVDVLNKVQSVPSAL